MVRPNHYSVEDIQNLFLEVCEENYGPLTRGNCFVAKDATVIDVETTILNGLNNQDIAKKKYLDMFNQTIWLDDNMCFSGNLNKFYSILPRVEIHIRYMNCAMNKYQYNHITSRVGYRDNNLLYYLNKLGVPQMNQKG